jgi:two-component system response regulator YesN
MNKGSKKKNLSDKVVEYILTRETEELEMLSVGSIAGNFGITRYKLLRSFKKDKKITLEKYLCRQRIIKAVLLLKTNESLTVKEIGEKVGYYSYNYFIRIFKRYIGISPGRFRELPKDKVCQEEKEMLPPLQNRT